MLGLFALPSLAGAEAWPTWAADQQPVPYCVNPANIPIGNTGGPIMSADDLVTKVKTALDTWVAVPGAAIRVTYTGLCDSDPANDRDGINTIGFGKLGSNAIGETRPQFVHGSAARQTKNRLLEADVLIDTRYAQSFDDMSQYINVVMPNILLHETGHFFGLQHTKEPCSIMRPYIDDVVGGLCDYDRDSLRTLYPAS